ncbi:uncharacterized protein LOC123538365 [Mercenaria mercenaria]|uniref:uncharacterized protein LOC123538365 n=1 Tax=Mercenaria mercenaria TaxID=6596 RepID=UPI00234FA0C9|nr:uncharacterized protein LOC123538365 [Mercenaria mercenaria]
MNLVIQQYHAGVLLLLLYGVCESAFTKLDSCLDEDEKVHRISEISLEKCKEECGKRSHCKAVNYRRLFQLCELLRVDHGRVLVHQGSKRSCLFVKKSDISIGSLPACNCTDGTSCDLETKTCRITECSKLELANARILGNMLSVGSRVKFTCNTGYLETSGEKYATCGTSSQWSYQPQCIRDCGPYPNVANAQLIGGGDSTIEGALLQYECLSGYTPIGSTSYLRCTNDGIWFDQNEVHCQKLIGSTCSAHSDCLLTGSMCVNSKCFCRPLYRYKTEINDCFQECLSFTDTFTPHVNTGFSGYNDVGYGDAVDSEGQCEDMCRGDPNCLSFEIWENLDYSDPIKMCNRASLTYEAILDSDPGSIVQYTWITIYSRNCI